jgi:hypothetical protein
MRMKPLALAAIALLLTACGGAATTSRVTVTVTESSAPKTIIDPYGSSNTVIDKNGTFIVGADIFPGRYRTAGEPGCYWARLSSGNARDIIEGHRNSGPQVVEIKDSDTAFLTQECGMWQMIPWL